jgi:hypothetical protein
MFTTLFPKNSFAPFRTALFASLLARRTGSTIPGCEDAGGGRAEMLIDDDTATGVGPYARGIQSQSYRIGGASGGEQNRVRLEFGAC